MKLRCTHNSIRIRIRKSELAQLSEERQIEETINFGNQISLTFAIIIQKEIEKVNAIFENNSIKINLPETIANNWINSNQVGIQVENPVSKTENLNILIEKDFPCLDREEENKADTFWELAPETPEQC